LVPAAVRRPGPTAFSFSYWSKRPLQEAAFGNSVKQLCTNIRQWTIAGRAVRYPDFGEGNDIDENKGLHRRKNDKPVGSYGFEGLS